MHKLPWIKTQGLVTKPYWDAKRWNLQESQENQEECVVVINSETDTASYAI